MAERKKSVEEKRGILLLALLAREGGGAFQKELSPAPDVPVRDALVKDGLIRKDVRARKIWLEVTDKGWDTAGGRLAALLPEDVQGAGSVLRAWLAHLSGYMAAQGLALSDLLATAAVDAAAAAPARPDDGPADDLPARIRAAYLAVTGGRLNTRALLKDLRPRLPEVPAATLDEALIRMQREGGARLYRIDNRIEITDADRLAAIQIAGEPRHLLWIEQ
ncbi:hypothetical protein EZH22_15540 [Xanthobacter dioxanivorans]|uniref:Uncharacterized protein n=1 Tax=Xanthobacter dioxanivorans TaxID=2528964 RepID=A0A974SHQ1_9HYPH|nr:hypothetical protein [Xanthobacter dioxanivorans]QRG04598.1 hypothetical protein EZH22_15540 [Xanthobacter dioxanivorans]